MGHPGRILDAADLPFAAMLGIQVQPTDDLLQLRLTLLILIPIVVVITRLQMIRIASVVRYHKCGLTVSIGRCHLGSPYKKKNQLDFGVISYAYHIFIWPAGRPVWAK